MFDELTDLDVDATLSHAAELRVLTQRVETRLLQTAAHYADPNGALTPVDVAGSLPGTEQLILLGGVGTPKVCEFAPAEFGAELGVSPASAAFLIGDALDLRHRLPRLWARIRTGEVNAWLGRKVAQATRTHPAAVAAQVDAKVAPWADRLSWGRLEGMVTAAIITADPAAAEDTAEAAKQTQGVWLSQQAHDGQLDGWFRAAAPDVHRFNTALDKIADDLALLGDTDPHQCRRATALGVIADPQQTLDLCTDADATRQPQPHHDEPADTRPGRLRRRPDAVLYLHLSQAAVTGCGGIGRVEGSARSPLARSPTGSATTTSPSNPSSTWLVRHRSMLTKSPTGYAKPPT